ncbi:MAG: hypothetical protein K8T90_13145 [Planctomycetes bacterium]|nr:hypothetical protein [Planctomycetota bacterium]
MKAPQWFIVVSLLGAPGVVLGALPQPAPARAADADYQPGDRVEILFGGTWYPGVVLKTGEKGFYVHYDGYADSWDSWMSAEKLRRGAAPVAPLPADKPAVAPAERPADKPAGKPADQPAGNPAPAVGDPAAAAGAGDPAVGERCEASWNQSWYEVDILKVEGARYFVHWRGYGSDADEWLTRDRLRRKGEDKEVLPRAGREGNGGGLPAEQMVGKDVEVFWHGKWWPATVQKTDGNRFWIRYAGPAFGKMEEWAVPERVRDVGGASRVRVSPQDVPGAKGLSGLWWREYMLAGKMADQQFTFFPDGRLAYSYLVKNPDAPDFEAIQRDHPEALGAYGIEGGKLHISLGGDADEWKPLTLERVNDDLMKLNGIPTMRARRFPRGTHIEGRYLNIDAAGISGQNRSQAWEWTFHADGTFEHTTTVTAFDPGAAPQQGATVLTGTYEFSGNHLTFRTKDGEDTYMAYPMGDDASYPMLFLGWMIVKRREK